MSLRFMLLWVAAIAIVIASHEASAQQAPAAQAAPAGQKHASPAGDGRATYQSMRENERWERAHRLSQLIGTEVRDKMGEHIGEVKDMVLGPDGNLAYAIVSTGGFLGAGDRLHAVPWQALESDGEGHYTVDLTKDRMENAPSFAPNNWPSLHDQRWTEQNRQFYSIEAN